MLEDEKSYGKKMKQANDWSSKWKVRVYLFEKVPFEQVFEGCGALEG